MVEMVHKNQSIVEKRRAFVGLTFCSASHRFYEKAGFQRISRESLPIEYSFPDRDSLLYVLYL